MKNAIEAFFLLPRFYFEMMIQPGFLGGIAFVPIIGTLSLIAGIALAIAERRKGLFAFLLPALGCGLFAMVMELVGRNASNDVKEPLIFGFLGSHLVLIGYLVYRFRQALPPTLALGLFSLTYVLFTTVVASLGPSSWK